MGSFEIQNRTTVTAFLQTGVDKSTRDFRDAGKKVQTGKSFITLSEAHDAGVIRRLNSDRSRLSAVLQHKANNVLMKGDNSRQLTLLQKIQAEAVRFGEEVITFENGSATETKEQIADRHLDNMEKLLNTREGGKYLLNPANPNEKPVASGSLKTINNLVNGISTSSYTNTEKNLDTIEVADETPVSTNPMHAGSEFIREYLAAAWSFRNDGPPNNNPTYAEKVTAGNRAQGVMLTVLNNISKKISDGENNNTKVETVILEEIQGIEAINLPVEAVKLRDAMTSLIASFNLATSMNRISDQLVSAASAA